MSTVSHEHLRRDVRVLGEMLGDVIVELAGSTALELVEEVRHLARNRREGDSAAERHLSRRVEGMTLAEARVAARAFSIFFDLANLAEDRHRIRVLRDREQSRHPRPISESLGAAIDQLHESQFSPEQTQQALDRLSIELVFTAHPSEAKRRSIRAKLRRMRLALQELDRPDLLPREAELLRQSIRSDLSVLWQTDFLRPERPTVLEEVERGLSITPRLWEVVPQVYASLRRALAARYPNHEFRIPAFLRFGSWMGGDRDGNPNVTAPVTRQTLAWLRETAIEQHLTWCRRMYDFLSISLVEVDTPSALVHSLDSAARQFPELEQALAKVAPLEIYRRWVKMIEWRLRRSSAPVAGANLAAGGYRDGAELVVDIESLCSSLQTHHNRLLADGEVAKWLDLARVFGLHLTTLDVRQDARRYREVLNELFALLELAPAYAELDDAARCELLSRTMDWSGPIPVDRLSPLAQDTLELFRLLYEAQVRFGADCIGGHVISLTQCPSDILGVLWLWRRAGAELRGTDGAPEPELRIVPLFEKIDDLRNASQTLGAILAHPVYRAYLARQHDRQVVMVGYSDSTKDGGYLAACWGLYEAQSRLHETAARHGVHLTFFHGRGGSLGRGGGPAARGILSLPPAALNGSLRLTEQGEVLAERYDDVQIALRHLEQVTWATLVASALPPVPPTDEWNKVFDELSKRSLAAYRQLVDQPGFIHFFECATPIEEIENLPIGSRPSRRRGERTLGDLRAIPWVFSWTQNRCLIPAWYGLGTALQELTDRGPASAQTLRQMYRDWPFMRAAIDNAALALAKADPYIARQYAELDDDEGIRTRCWRLIAQEYDRTRAALLGLIGGTELLGETPWFQASVEVRNPYIDPLNLIQVELLKRKRALSPDAPPTEAQRLRDLLRLTVQGIAAGMRTTG